jgi:CheY-like chemotaxis protein
MPGVLIIEDETTLRSSMAKGLAKLPGIVVHEAGSLEQAVAVMDRDPPELILSDIDLPDRSGIEILGELGKRGLRIPVVFISAYLKAYGAQIPRHANVEVREKPVGLEELRDLVRDRIGTVSSEAEVAPFEATDYLQLACMGRRSVVIDVGGEGERRQGRIIVYEGEVWAVRDADGEGEDAFRRLVMSSGVSVRCRTLTEQPGERNVTSSWESLLLDAAREADEESVAGVFGPDESSPATDAGGGPTEAAAADDGFDEIWDRGIAALLDHRYEEARSAFLDARAVRPADGRIAANLERLKQMGYGGEESSI